jgi:tetratricopeptide (TPR) repeat protein
MRINKEVLRGIVIIAVIALGVVGVKLYQGHKIRNSLAGAIADLSPQGAPPETVEGLRKAIAAYEEEQTRFVRLAAQTGIYWKILAARLQDRGLHRDALDALERAIQYNPEDPSLYYSTGVSAAIMAKSSLDFAGAGGGSPDGNRERYYALAESGYLRAISLNDRYARPRYGIGVLYVFELDRPAEAVPHLLRYLEQNTGDVDAMFVLARAYYMIGRYQEAVDIYDRIIPLTKDQQKREEAEKNRARILDEANG